MGPLQRDPATAPAAFSQDPPRLRRRGQISLVKNRMREIRTSGSVRGGGGNVPTYSAGLSPDRGKVTLERSLIAQPGMGAKELEPPCGMKIEQPGQEEAPEQFSEHTYRQEKRRP